MTDLSTPAGLKAARVAAQLSQHQLADRLGIRPITLSNWELGREPITASEAELRAALGRQGPPPSGARAIALQHLLWISQDTATARRHAAALQARVRAAIAALEALREPAAP